MAALSVLLERALFHLLVVPAVGVAGSWITGWNWWVFVGIDAVLSISYEVARVGLAGVTIGVKDVIPVLLLLQVKLPAPSATAVAVCLSTLTATGMIASWYRWRRRHHPAQHEGQHWRRPGLALTAALGGAALGLTAAGMALVLPLLASPLALTAAGPWAVALHLQTSPRRGESRTRWFPAVVSRVRDLSGRTAPAAAVSR